MHANFALPLQVLLSLFRPLCPSASPCLWHSPFCRDSLHWLPQFDFRHKYSWIALNAIAICALTSLRQPTNPPPPPTNGPVTAVTVTVAITVTGTVAMSTLEYLLFASCCVFAYFTDKTVQQIATITIFIAAAQKCNACNIGQQLMWQQAAPSCCSLCIFHSSLIYRQPDCLPLSCSRSISCSISDGSI